MSTDPYDPRIHYDRVIPAWELLLGDDLHYGLFEHGDEDLDAATRALTERMAGRGDFTAPGLEVLDVGCGTGRPACFLAERFAARVTGISTSDVGLQAARERAQRQGLGERLVFQNRDGMDNRFRAETFDRVWIMESSHLMSDKRRLMAEGARVLARGGRLVLCDLVLRSPMPTPEVVRNRDALLLLRDVFGRAKMEPLEFYRVEAVRRGLRVVAMEDLSRETRPTFARWRDNASAHRSRIVELLGEDGWRKFGDSLAVLDRFWAEGKLGYGLLAAVKE